MISPRTGRRAAVLALALALTPVAAAQVPFTRLTNIPYGDGHVRHVLDLYLPTADGSGEPQAPRPLVIWIHGGGWQSGSKDMFRNTPRPQALIDRGFMVAAINYRLSGDAIFPAQIHDCKAAVRFLRANAAAYGIDPRFIGVWGSSAGGHLVALLGTTGDVADAEGAVGPHDDALSRVQSVADHFGPTDFFNVPNWHLGPATAEAALLGFSLGDVQANVNNPAWADRVALARLAGPVTHASADDPPFIIAHGTADTTVDPLHSDLMHAALQAVGVPSTLRIVPGAGHSLPRSEDEPVYQHFLATLTPPACPADITRDGVINEQDTLALLAPNAQRDPTLDFTLDGRLDFFDVLAFLSQADAGCP